MSVTRDAQLEALTERLRERGYKMTAPRRAVLVELLAVGSTHVTAEDLAASVRRRQPDVDVSTVYRTLTLLRELDVIQHTHLGHGGAVYHLGETHQHLVCEECGGISDVPVGALDDLAAHLRDRYGFELHPGHFALMGRCARHDDQVSQHDTRDEPLRH